MAGVTCSACHGSGCVRVIVTDGDGNQSESIALCTVCGGSGVR